MNPDETTVLSGASVAPVAPVESPDQVVDAFMKAPSMTPEEAKAQAKADAETAKQEAARAREAEQVKAALDKEALHEFEREQAAQQKAANQQAALDKKTATLEAERNKKIIYRAGSAIADTANKQADKILSAPTTGGIGLLLGVIIFFLWAAVPVNNQGHTRLELLWNVLTGNADLAVGGGTGTNQNYGGGSSGDFGTPQTGAKTGGYTGPTIDPGVQHYSVYDPSDDFSPML